MANYIFEDANRKILEVEPELQSLAAIQQFIETELIDYEDCFKAMTQLSVAIDELGSNVIKYGGNNKDKVVVSLFVKDDKVTIEIVDKGMEFNPLEEKDPDITASAEDRDIGGLGIFIVKKTMDSVVYQRINNENHLAIVKTLR